MTNQDLIDRSSLNSKQRQVILDEAERMAGFFFKCERYQQAINYVNSTL